MSGLTAQRYALHQRGRIQLDYLAGLGPFAADRGAERSAQRPLSHTLQSTVTDLNALPDEIRRRGRRHGYSDYSQPRTERNTHE
jgi:hypothetical protein